LLGIQYIFSKRSRSLYAVAHSSSVYRLSVCNARSPYSAGWNS